MTMMIIGLFLGRFGHVIVIPKDGNNLLKKDVWEELILLDGMIKNVTAYYEGESYTYEHLCARWQDDCFNNDILNLIKIIE